MTAPDDKEPYDPQLSILVGGGLYTLLIVGGVVWLWSRDRLELLRTQSLGTHGLPAAVGVGLGTGILGAVLVALLAKRLPVLGRLEGKVRGMFAPMGDVALLTLVLVGAIAEEVFFRLAVQDAFGLAGSVAAYVLVNSTTAGWAWIPITALHATVFGLLMQFGFGLLGTTLANAVLNYLCLRRILST